MANQQQPLQKYPTIPASKQPVAGMGVDGLAKKVYQSGNQKFGVAHKPSADLPLGLGQPPQQQEFVEQQPASLQMHGQHDEQFDTYYGGNHENNSQHQQ